MNEKTPIFIHMDIIEDVVKLVTQNILGVLGPSGTDLEALHGFLLKFGEESKRLCTSVEFFVDWIASQTPTWVA